MQCPKCNSLKIVKYGSTHYGKQRFRCQDCQRQFVEHPSRQPIDQATRSLIEKLLKERLALAAISRSTGVSERWLQMYVNQKYYVMYVNQKYYVLPQEVNVTPKKSVS